MRDDRPGAPSWPKGKLVPLALAVLAALIGAASLAAAGSRTPLDPQAPSVGLPTGPLTWSEIAQIVEGAGPSVETIGPGALPRAPEAVADDVIPAPSGLAMDFRHYPTSGEISQFLRQLEEAYPQLVETLEIGRSAQGRPILAARLTNTAAPGNPADRPVMYVDGQHHAREMIGQAVALYTLWWLADRHGEDPLATYLLDTRVVVTVPSVNIDGNDIALADWQEQRKTADPSTCDDDGDGRYDEDSPLGYGYGTHTLRRYHFTQSWADGHPDDPFVGPWYAYLVGDEPVEELGRFTGAYGGPVLHIPEVDKDGDGRSGEDPLGGTDPNRNYDIYWELGEAPCQSEVHRGPHPFSERETRAVRDLVSEIDHLSTALSYHSGVDVILHPWGYSRDARLEEAWIFELLGRKGSQLTEVNGFPGSPHTWAARGLYLASGSTMDYLYADHGAYALSPEVFGDDGRTVVERLGETGTFTVGMSTAAQYNPSPDGILPTVDRWLRFAVYLLAATPNVELSRVDADAEAVTLTIANDGVLPAVVRGRLVSGERVLAQLGPDRLEASEVDWRVDRGLMADGDVELLVEVEQPVSTRPHTIERGRWVLRLAKEGVEVVEGSLRPWTDLSAYFPDGWWAPEQFDEPGRYHLPPGQPIPVTPPTPTRTPTPSPSPSPTAGPSASPTLTATASTTPSATPTATSTATSTTEPTFTPSPTATPPDRFWRVFLAWALKE